jgi:hypothetical protein
VRKLFHSDGFTIDMTQFRVCIPKISFSGSSFHPITDKYKTGARLLALWHLRKITNRPNLEYYFLRSMDNWRVHSRPSISRETPDIGWSTVPESQRKTKHLQLLVELGM